MGKKSQHFHQMFQMVGFVAGSVDLGAKNVELIYVSNNWKQFLLLSMAISSS